MIRKNMLRTLTITALTAMALTACSKSTGTVPETQPATGAMAQESLDETLTGSTTTDENNASREASDNEQNETDTQDAAGKNEAAQTGTAEMPSAGTGTASGTQTDTGSEAEITDETSATAEETTTEPETTTEAHTHSYTSKVTTEAGCAAEGIMTFTCECGDTYTESIEKTAHSFGAYTYNNDATDLVDGTETATCSVCGEKDTRTSAGTKLEHVHSYTPYISSYPTCTAEGVMTSTCRCGDSYTEPINATGHSFGEYVYNNDATYEADGTETATCSVCGANDTRTAAGTKLVQETTEAEKNMEELQSFFDYIKENWNAYTIECMYAQEGFTETFPFLDVVSDTQCFVYYLEGGDTSPIDNFKSTHDMTIWHDKGDDFIGEFKEGKVHEVMFARSSY